jgi:hypothetical protein
VPVIFKSFWLYLHIGFAKRSGGDLRAAAAALGYLLKARAPARWERLSAAERLDPTRTSSSRGLPLPG